MTSPSERADATETIRLRPAGHDDLDAVVTVFRSCWSTSYAPVMPPALVATMTPDRARSLWFRALREAAPGEIVVAVRDRVIVGVTRWAVPDTAAPGWVHSLYVDPASQGLGVGRLLLGAAEQAIAGGGASAARLWVFAANAPSRRFYEARGWSADGTTRVEAEFGEPEIGMAKELTGR